MASKPKLSISKQLKIKTLDLLFGPEAGKYFPIRSTNLAKYVPTLRRDVPMEYYGHLIREITAFHATDAVFLNGKKKRTLKELASEIPFHLDLDAEFGWAKNILELNISELNRFVSLSEQYSDYLLTGDYRNAAQKLDEIEDGFGYSIWLLKNRIAFLQLSEGLEVQKRYAQNIKINLKEGSLPRFLLYWLSVRNEEQTSVSRFTSQIEGIIAKLNPSKQEGFDFYVRYHLLGIEPMNPEEFVHILRTSYSTSIIDYYESFVALLRILSVHDDSKSVAKVYFYLLKERTVTDKRISILREFFHIDQPVDRQYAPETMVYEHLLRGDFAGAESCVSQFATTDPCNPIFIIALAEIRSFLSDGIATVKTIATDSGGIATTGLRALLIEKLSLVIREGTVKASKAYNELNKLALNFNGFPWVATISHTFANENFLSLNPNEASLLIPLKAAVCHPIFLAHLRLQALHFEYQKLCDVAYSNSTILLYQQMLLNGNPGQENLRIYPIFNNYLGAIIHYRSADFVSSIGYSNNVISSSTGYHQRIGYGLISRCYIRTSDLIAACETICTCYIYHRDYYPFLPLEEYGKTIRPGTKEWRTVNHLIDLSIVCDAYVKQIGDGMETSRRFAYEDFLSKLGLEKPSELKNLVNQFDRAKLIYYLSFICVESNMDTSCAFEGGSQEVVEERLAICRILTEIDPDNAATYRAEIKELVRKLVINSRRQEVDQSRIYVDIQSVKEKAQYELKENFERYKAYLKYDLKLVVGNDNKNKYTVDANTDKTTSPTSVISTPENEFYELLVFLMDVVGKLYLSTSIGLDRFISTRIRHGDLERTMRSPMQKHNLITKRKVKNGPYIRNDFWLSKISSTKEIANDVNNAFVKFSEAYDQLIGRITNEWLQIKRNDKPNGLFSFELLGEELEVIVETITAETTLSEFIDIVIQHLDNKLIFSLLAIRDKLYIDGKSQGKALLNNLLEDVNKLLPQGLADLQGAVSQARTEFGAQFDKIIEWFVPSFSGNSSPYTIEDAVMVAEAIIKEGYPNFKINVEADEESAFLIHGKLPIFMDVFINIFENVIKRSGLDIPEAYVRIWACQDENEDDINVISCSVSNALGDIPGGADAVAIELKRKKGLLETESYHDYLAQEGNSGLFKIYKSVRDFYLKDSPIEPTVNFGIDDNRFDIILTVPFKFYTLPDEEAN